MILTEEGRGRQQQRPKLVETDFIKKAQAYYKVRSVAGGAGWWHRTLLIMVYSISAAVEIFSSRRRDSSWGSSKHQRYNIRSRAAVQRLLAHKHPWQGSAVRERKKVSAK
jgi:hypothetical protein